VADVDPLADDWTPVQIEVMQRLRDWAVGFTELNQHLAAWMQLPGSDANALGQITWAAESDEPLSPAQLSRLLGMTSGATTILLNRLETAGHIRRSRESADRRRVTLRPSPAARERARGFMAFAGAEIATTLHAADPAELRTVAAFLATITAAAGEANRRLG
jgi:DNA-binding MarR family transcriptional regulator